MRAGGGGGGRRRPTELSFTPRHLPPPSSARDSDASLRSGRPSSSSLGGGRSSIVPISDRSYQLSALRTINSYLSSHSLPFSLRSSPLPSARDILETLKFLLSRLDFPSSRPEDDLPLLLKHLHCPLKLNKSALKAPGTPHSWPSLLAVIHWLVQISNFHDYSEPSTASADLFIDGAISNYALESYLNYIRGEDDAVEALDSEFLGKLEQERDAVVEGVNVLEKEGADLEARLDGMRAQPSRLEALEKERGMLEEDVRKFNVMIEQVNGKMEASNRALEEKEMELRAKEEERKRICEENEELKKRVNVQTVNLRDAERMKREIQIVERDIEEAESARNVWEEKCWDLDAALGRKFKDLEALSIKCNQAIKRLKLANELQYVLNANGSTPVEVLGINYKSTLKPALDSFLDDINKSSMAKLEERISLQQQSVDVAAKIEAKRGRLNALQSHIDEVEAQINWLKKEIQDYTSQCEFEAREVIEQLELQACNSDALEKEAKESLKICKLRLQEASRQNEEELQSCAHELFLLVDTVSKYKEYTATKILEMKRDFSAAAGAVSDAYKNSLQAQFGISFGSAD